VKAPAENWLPVPEWEDRYEVSDLGRVRSIDRVVTRSGHTMRLRGRLLTPKVHTKGYLRVSLSRGRGGVVDMFVHTLVLLAFVGPRPAELEACHGNGDPTDNRVANLLWDTPSENQYDVVRHGRSRQRQRTHCPARHELRAPNLVPSSLRQNRRDCLACSRARARAQQARRTGQPYDLAALRAECYAEIMPAA
jgi:hypothetical protein